MLAELASSEPCWPCSNCSEQCTMARESAHNGKRDGRETRRRTSHIAGGCWQPCLWRAWASVHCSFSSQTAQVWQLSLSITRYITLTSSQPQLLPYNKTMPAYCSHSTGWRSSSWWLPAPQVERQVLHQQADQEATEGRANFWQRLRSGATFSAGYRELRYGFELSPLSANKGTLPACAVAGTRTDC